MTLQIGLDVTALEGDQRTRGMGRVAQAYFEQLSQESEIELVPYSRGDFPRLNSNGKYGWTDELFDPLKLAWFLRKDPPDLVQILDPMKVPSFSSVPVITMVHDLIPYLYRERYQTSIWSWFLHWRMKRQIARSGYIITPSRCTADDLTMLFEIDQEKIEPVYHGINHDRFYPREADEVEEVRERYHIQTPFVLMVADLRQYDPRKKLEDVVEAWDDQLLSGVDLVVVGQQGEYSQRLRDRWTGPDRELVMPGFVNDDELASLYTGAEMLLFPSRYEGFGFPVIESMACGTVPVARGVGSVEEIVGDRGILLGEDQFQDRLMDVVSDHLEDRSKREQCIQHAQQFTWKKTIDKLIPLYRALANGMVPNRAED